MPGVEERDNTSPSVEGLSEGQQKLPIESRLQVLSRTSSPAPSQVSVPYDTFLLITITTYQNENCKNDSVSVSVSQLGRVSVSNLVGCLCLVSTSEKWIGTVCVCVCVCVILIFVCVY